MINRNSPTLLLAALLTAALTTSCTSAKDDGPSSPEPQRQALEGPARPALLLTHAWFWTDDEGTPHPGPARLDIWRETNGKWSYTRLEDADSNVFHKAMPWNGGILTIGAQKAMLKKWHFTDGSWQADTLWQKSWGGRFDRLRDIEIADVDGDGIDELVIATHDSGVVAVVNVDADGKVTSVIEMDGKADTFVHEIEVGDIDGDGKLEFFATPSDRNRADASQAGGVVMYRWNGSSYDRSWVEKQEGTHAKEILAADLDGDGHSELFSVLEAELGADKRIAHPVEIRQYTLNADGSFSHSVLGTIDDRQTRFLVPGDFDGDGRAELIAAAMKTGVYHFAPPAPGSPAGTAWTRTLVDSNSSGFEHAAWATDLDGDGRTELYVAADDQRELKRYEWTGKGFKRSLLGKLDADVLTWNITDGRM